jgi:membrane AbrB-like protein
MQGGQFLGGELIQFALTCASATLFGYLAKWIRLPGGLLVGAIFGAAAATVLWGDSLELPLVFLGPAFALVGLLSGVLVTRRRLIQLVPYLFPALVSALLLIAAGWAIAGLLEMLEIAPPAAILATSPGALSVLVAAAADQGEGAVEVALFHVVRLIAVIIAIPIVLRFRPRDVT